ILVHWGLGRVGRNVSAIRLPVFEPQRAGDRQGLVELEVAERVALDAHLERAVSPRRGRVGGLRRAPQGPGPGPGQAGGQDLPPRPVLRTVRQHGCPPAWPSARRPTTGRLGPKLSEAHPGRQTPARLLVHVLPTLVSWV